jgi:hypothetical protein
MPPAPSEVPADTPPSSEALQGLVGVLSTCVFTLPIAHALAGNKALDLYLDAVESVQKPVKTASNALSDLSNRPPTGSVPSPKDTFSKAWSDLSKCGSTGSAERPVNTLFKALAFFR